MDASDRYDSFISDLCYIHAKLKRYLRSSDSSRQRMVDSSPGAATASVRTLLLRVRRVKGEAAGARAGVTQP